MSQKEAVSVNILDREYRIACDPGERRQLLDAADYLDQQMRSMRDSGNLVGVEKVAVLAALNIANELLDARQREANISENVAGKIRNLRDRLDDARLD
ncbi:MAG: cell division protein ZapA [Xanthomonadales bacterium]|nr:cell division protein ZapA [Xanthomonadales bacterium]